MDLFEIEGAAEIGVGLLGLLADLGLAICAGRRLSWRAVSAFWLACLGTAIPLWTDFENFFNHWPGWAVLTSGLWFLLVLATLAVSAAGLRAANTRPPP